MQERRRRIEAMKRYLDEHADAIAAMERGQVVFDFGQSVSGKITRIDNLLRSDYPVDRLSA